MTIYTSYFAKANKLPASAVQIAICRYRPSWFTGPLFTELAPSAMLLQNYKSTHDTEFYTECFTSYLNSLDADKVFEELSSISQGRDIVLLCYERSQDFCHRHLVAEWLQKHGHPCTEYEF